MTYPGALSFYENNPIYGGFGQALQNQMAAQQRAFEEQYRSQWLGSPSLGSSLPPPRNKTLRESLQDETDQWLRKALD